MKHLIVFFSCALLLGACNMPDDSPQIDGINIHTVAAQTVAARMSETGTDAAPATQQPVQNTASPVETQTPTTARNTLSPSPVSDCDHITWGADITIPDGTTLNPGQVFTKTWQLKNSGTCNWTSDYALVFVSGDAMQAPAYVQVTSNSIAPGQKAEISITLVAPTDDGEYQGFYKLRNADGTNFGLGDSSKSFWVKIQVGGEAGVMFDFIAQADEAKWGSGTAPINFAKPGHEEITYGGQASDSGGFASVQDDVKIEDGGISGKILTTGPKQVQDGYVVGRYPLTMIGFGNRLQGRLGFLPRSDGTCGIGRATFLIYYTVGDDMGTLEQLGSWEERCDGEMRKINIDLEALVGKELRFYLALLADGSPDQDWAVWSSLGVMR
ncbi:MAG: hypothetical protein IMY76_02410 [Chloroflexi bacterium]|nr:hypothetical protein [Chloroflexota bacterium]